MTTPDTANENARKLVASVRAGLMIAEDYTGFSVWKDTVKHAIESFTELEAYLAALEHDHELAERDLSDLRPRYAALAEFVREVAKMHPDGNPKFVIDEAKAMLAKLAGVKTT